MNLLDAARPAAERLAALPRDARIRVVAHYDADGVSSAAVIVQTLRRLGRTFHVTYTHEHAEAYYASLHEEPYEANVFLDIGQTVLTTIASGAGLQIVLDHHMPTRPHVTASNLVVVNPHVVGEDGMKDASGSTTAFAFALAVSESNWDLAPLALAGAYGDRQDRPTFHGWNRIVLDEAVRRGSVQVRPRLDLDDVPLRDLLSFPSPKVAPLVHADAERILRDHGLPPQATPLELGEHESEILAGLLVTRFLRAGEPAFRVKEFFRPVPHALSHQGLPIPRMASLLVAATRENEAGLGLAFLLGDAAARSELESLETRFRGALRGALDRLRQEGSREFRRFRAFQVTSAAYTGEVCSLAIERVLPRDRPVLAYTISGDLARISARGTDELVAAGLDLGPWLDAAARPLGGFGGGHAVASGATVPAARLEEFFRSLDGDAT